MNMTAKRLEIIGFEMLWIGCGVALLWNHLWFFPVMGGVIALIGIFWSKLAGKESRFEPTPAKLFEVFLSYKRFPPFAKCFLAMLDVVVIAFAFLAYLDRVPMWSFVTLVLIRFGFSSMTEWLIKRSR